MVITREITRSLLFTIAPPFAYGLPEVVASPTLGISRHVVRESPCQQLIQRVRLRLRVEVFHMRADGLDRDDHHIRDAANTHAQHQGIQYLPLAWVNSPPRR